MKTITPHLSVQNIIGLLLTDFFPYEPCAVGLDLCPLGYRIPALESDLRNILLNGWSFLAEDMVGGPNTLILIKSSKLQPKIN